MSVASLLGHRVNLALNIISLFVVLYEYCNLLQGVGSESIFSETVPPGYVWMFSFNGWCIEVVD